MLITTYGAGLAAEYNLQSVHNNELLVFLLIIYSANSYLFIHFA